MVVSYLKFLHTPSYQYQHIIVTITDIHALFKPLVHMIVISPLLCFICILYFYVYNFSLRVSVSKFLFCIPDDGHTFGPKRVGFFTYKLISVSFLRDGSLKWRMFAFVGAIVAYNYGDFFVN